MLVHFSIPTIIIFFLNLFLFAACTNEKPFYPEKPIPIESDTAMAIREYGDILRETDRDSEGFLDDPALTSITREYGATIIENHSWPYKSILATANLKPWSSWWFPKNDDFLFKDIDSSRLSTLSKYDKVRQKRFGNSGSASNFERQEYNPMSAPWEGLCDAWALASISKPEPKNPVTISITSDKNIKFEIYDLKALLLKTYEAAEDSDLRYYGQKFTGDYRGWIFPDLFPEQFHRFLEIQLFEKKQAFIMDYDAGIEIWNVPVFKANFTMDILPSNPNAVFVRTWLYSAESVLDNEKDFVGTREGVREYDYVLEGNRDINGNLVIKSGYWVKGPDGIDSRKNHPDYVIQVSDPNKLVRKSWNPEIDVKLVDEILNKSF